jgi:DNA-binding CsgD family transcriptional regulator
MEWEGANRVKQQIYQACHRGLGVDDLAREVRRLVGKVVPFDSSCWHPTDPATGLITGGIFEISADLTTRVSEIEFFEEDFNALADLAGRPCPVGILSEETGGRPDRSARYRDVLRPLGLESELRAVFVARSGTWGAAGLFREQGRPDFDSEEARFMASVAGLLAQGFRTALLTSAASAQDVHDAPGLVLFNDDGSIEDVNAAAARWIDELWGRGPRPASLPVPIEQVAATARAVLRGGGVAGDAVARARVLTRSGQWLVLHGTGFGGSSGRTAVIMEAARPAEIAPLVVEAFGLSDRECQVVRLVLRGSSTQAIAQQLSLSPLTVQDHLKAIFDKMGVRSRREIAGRIFFDQSFSKMIARQRHAS